MNHTLYRHQLHYCSVIEIHYQKYRLDHESKICSSPASYLALLMSYFLLYITSSGRIYSLDTEQTQRHIVLEESCPYYDLTIIINASCHFHSSTIKRAMENWSS